MNKELQFNLDIVDKRGPNVRIVDIIDTRGTDYDNFIDNILVSLMFRGYMLEDVESYVEGFNYITKTYKLINNNVKFSTILINCKVYGILNYEYHEDKPTYANVNITLNKCRKFNSFYECEDYFKYFICNTIHKQ